MTGWWVAGALYVLSRTRWWRPTCTLVATLTLVACGPTLPSVADVGGCQVRAGRVAPEGSASGGFASGTVAAEGGAATVVGTCPEQFRVVTRTPGGSMVCYGPDEFCIEALKNAPITATTGQLRELKE